MSLEARLTNSFASVIARFRALRSSVSWLRATLDRKSEIWFQRSLFMVLFYTTVRPIFVSPLSVSILLETTEGSCSLILSSEESLLVAPLRIPEPFFCLRPGVLGSFVVAG